MTNWNVSGGKLEWSLWRCYTGIPLEGLSKIMENLR